MFMNNYWKYVGIKKTIFSKTTMGLDFYTEISGEISLKNILFKKQLARKDETCVDSVDLMGP